LRRLRFDRCQPNRVIMMDADLTGANLYRANLYGTDLRMADLTGANLANAWLPWADLIGADLTNANLYGAASCSVSVLLAPPLSAYS